MSADNEEEVLLPIQEQNYIGDNWLSKNIRPLTLIFSWILLSFIVVVMLFDHEVPHVMLNAVAGLVALITSGYFGLREFGKFYEKKQKE